jgi:hypothetical protein
MQPTKIKISINVIVIVFVVLVVLVSGYQVGHAQEEIPDRKTPLDVGLFLPLSNVTVMDEAPDEIIIQSRDVMVDFDLLAQDFIPGETLTLNLFEGVVYTAVFDKIEIVDDSLIWYGHLANIDSSLVILVIRDGSLVGKITSPQGFYQIKSYAGVQKIIQFNPSGFPKEEEPIPVETSTNRGKEARSGITAADDGTMVDVMVVYTADAAAALGDPVASITLAVAEANTSYANSDINFRINLVHSAQITYTEIVTDSSSTYLAHLKGISDGNMDDVHTWRDTYHADHVVLITDSGGCGLGYLMTTVSGSFQDSAFSTVRDDCLTGNLTFPHELGHNMGARHDWYVDDGTTPYTYAHGYINMIKEFRTVMAYSTECNDESGSCPRVAYWSNPNKTYNEAAMGEPEGSGTGCVEGTSYNPDPHASDCDADNHLTLNNNATTVAQFRSSEIAWSGATDSDWNTASNWSQSVTGETEGFENSVPPTDWAEYQTGTSGGPGWQQDNCTNYCPYSGDYKAFHNDDYTGDISWLIMEPITVPVRGTTLTFWERNRNMSGYAAEGGYHGVQISTGSCDPNDGAFTQLAEFSADASAAWTERSIDLSSYALQEICVAFKYEGNNAAEWYLDQVQISDLHNERVPRSIDDVVIPSSPASGRFPEISSGTAHAREFIVEAGARVTMTNGTFNVFGNWDEQGTTAVFSGTGGTVILGGALDQTLDMNTDTGVNNLQIGNGSSKEVTLNNNVNVAGTLSVESNATLSVGSNTIDIGGMTTIDSSAIYNAGGGNSNLGSSLTISGTLNANTSSIDVNGAITIESGATLDGDTGTINLAGNWMDYGNGFTAGTSSVILDGASQSINKTTTQIMLSEDFSDGDGQACCSSAYLPSGWVRENVDGSGWLGGDMSDGNGGIARLWTNSTDGWLFTTSLELATDVSYQLSYDYRVRLATETLTLLFYQSTSQSSSSVTQVGTVSASSNTWNSNSHTFTVPSSGTYYLGFRVQQSGSSDSGIIDNIQLIGTKNPTFYNLQVESSTSVTVSKDLVAQNNLTVGSGATLNLGTNIIEVNGTLTNNGTIKQTQDVSGSSDVTFFNTGGYGGITLNAETVDLGDTTVEIRGNQDCTITAGETVKRCFKITPTNAASRDATITFFFTDSELTAGNTCSTLNAYHWNDSSWDALTLDTTYATSGRDCSSTPRSIRVKDVTSFSEFALKSSVPTAVTLSSLTGSSGSNQIAVLAVVILSVILVGGISIRTRKSREI